MKIKVSLLMNILLSIVLVVSIAANLTGAVDYDPWLDVNDDGYGGIDDIVSTAEHFGASGDPIKLCNITNWPEPVQPLFTETLKLKNHKFYSNPSRHALIDEIEAYPPGSLTDDYTMTPNVGPIEIEVYNRTFVYESMPTRPYRILGNPLVWLPVNITTTSSPGVVWYLRFQAYIGKIAWDGGWTELGYIGQLNRGANQPASDVYWQFGFSHENPPLNTTINPYERLAIRLVGSSYITGGLMNVYIYVACNDNLHCMAQIPICTP